MSVAFDNNVLSLLLHPDADVPNDPSTGKPITRAQERIEYLIDELKDAGERILVPAPILGEFLTVASSDYLDIISRSAYFEIPPFDQRAAIEAAAQLKRSIRSGRGKKLGLAGDWQKIKIDRQFVAIAKVHAVKAIYTTDAHVEALARDCGIVTIHVADLLLPPSNTPLLDLPEMQQEAPTRLLLSAGDAQSPQNSEGLRSNGEEQDPSV